MMAYQTPLMERILDILRSGNDWMSRSDIANRLRDGEPLSSYDITLLENLVYQGSVERDERTRGRYATYFVYRAKGNTNGETS